MHKKNLAPLFAELCGFYRTKFGNNKMYTVSIDETLYTVIPLTIPKVPATLKPALLFEQHEYPIVLLVAHAPKENVYHQSIEGRVIELSSRTQRNVHIRTTYFSLSTIFKTYALDFEEGREEMDHLMVKILQKTYELFYDKK